MFPLEIAVSEMLLEGSAPLLQGILRDISARKQAEEALLKNRGLAERNFQQREFSSIATDAAGVIQIFNVGAERMLGYAAAEAVNRVTPADISDPREIIARAAAFEPGSRFGDHAGLQRPGVQGFAGYRGHLRTYLHAQGWQPSPAVVSVTALRDAREAVIGYLLIGTDNTARMRW